MASSSLVVATAVLVAAYAAVILFLVIRGARQTTSLSDYAVGSLAFHPVMVGFSLAASMTSAATFIINPGFIALYGISGIIAYAIFLPLALYISLIVLTKSFRRHGQAVKALTMAQWIGKRYGSKRFAFFFALLSLLLITFIVLIAVGMTKVLSKALDVEEIWVLTGLVIFIFGYMMFGGANSMVYTNAIQAGIMIVVAILLLTSGYEHFSGGVHTLLDRLAAIDPNLSTWKNPSSPLFRDAFEIIFCSMVVGVAIVCQPHIITRSLLLKDDNQVNRFLATTIIVQILFFSVVIAGLYARLAFPDLTADGQALKMDGIIPAYVVSEFPVWIGLVVILGLLSAGLSTLENLIQSLSTTVTADILQPVMGISDDSPQAPRLVWINRIVIAALAVVSFWLSREQLLHPNLSVGIFAQNGVYAYFSAAFIPVLFGIFLNRVHRAAPIIASVVALVTHFAVYYGQLTPYTSGPIRNPAVAATLAILAAVVSGLIVHALTWKKMKPVSPLVQD
ncbi:MAG: sodium:solute symporter [Lewinellaceae bacterium]|nr:sodium:solute symporter [Saprospiraceae bacterium]MCB9313577.1 sodium:solute symporter [Lewinellaceae bacterium]HRW74358.1 sodium:solute symporter [Saprospiraceae bacterium]